MSAMLASPRVKVHIGDGFAFLASNTSTYDVIITDSSDPEGPAVSLFQAPFFQLVYDALREGGHACSQGESLWLHLPLIKELRGTVEGVFGKDGGKVDYAFTTIPTYPAGQIGFTMGAKAHPDGAHDLRTPLREVKGCRYYNSDVHRAAFVLPEFGRRILATGENILPSLTPEPTELQKQGGEKKVLLLGSGFVARPAAEYIIRSSLNKLTIACRTLASAQALASGLPRTSAVSLDVNNTEELEKAVAAHDLVVSLIPYTYHAAVIRAAIKTRRTHVVTTSYISPAIRALENEIKEAGIVVMNEIGLDPGIDHLYAVKLIDEVHKKGGKIKTFESFCGGLPSPKDAGNPLGYKFSWSSRGVLLALLNSASYYRNGQRVDVEGKELMKEAKPFFISPPYAFVAYPNRDSTGFREWYGINGEGEGETVIRGTLRYQGFPEFIKSLVELGWLDDKPKEWLKDGLKWEEVMAKAIGASGTDEASLVARIDQLCSFPNESERSRILAGFKWLGLLPSSTSSSFTIDSDSATAESPLVEVRPKDAPNLLDTLCARLEALMQYAPGERDLVMLQHKFGVTWADGTSSTITATLELHGEPTPTASQGIAGTLGGGVSAMSRTVGVPCGIATQLVLDGVIGKNGGGIYAPYSMDVVAPLLAEVEREGLGMVERVL